MKVTFRYQNQNLILLLVATVTFYISLINDNIEYSSLDLNEKTPFEISTSKIGVINPSKDGKVLITGTGRSGTTFLIELLTLLNLDTGFHRGNYTQYIFSNCGSGMEYDIDSPHKFLKNPRFIQEMEHILNNTMVHTVVVPIRNYTESALSRVQHGQGQPGGLWGNATDTSSQETFYYQIMAQYLVSMVRYDIATVFLDFNRMVADHVYLYQKLKHILPPSISLDRFEKTFKEASWRSEHTKNISYLTLPRLPNRFF